MAGPARRPARRHAAGRRRARARREPRGQRVHRGLRRPAPAAAARRRRADRRRDAPRRRQRRRPGRPRGHVPRRRRHDPRGAAGPAPAGPDPVRRDARLHGDAAGRRVRRPRGAAGGDRPRERDPPRAVRGGPHPVRRRDLRDLRRGRDGPDARRLRRAPPVRRPSTGAGSPSGSSPRSGSCWPRRSGRQAALAYRAGVSQTGYSVTFSGLPSFAEGRTRGACPYWPLVDRVGERGPNVPQQPVPQVAITVLPSERATARVEQLAPGTSPRTRWPSPLTVPGCPRRGAPRRPVDEDRRQLVAEVVAADGLVEDDALAAERGDGHAVELEADAGRRSGTGSACRRPGRAAPSIEALPPPDSNSCDRLTVATPSSIERPSSVVPSGIAVYIAGRAAISASFGPVEQRAHRGRGDGLGLRDLAQDRGEARRCR